eukprot:2511332-Pleurochrysis_carterae.AAC.2
MPDRQFAGSFKPKPHPSLQPPFLLNPLPLPKCATAISAAATPDVAGRLEILRKKTQKLRLAADVDLNALADDSHGTRTHTLTMPQSPCASNGPRCGRFCPIMPAPTLTARSTRPRRFMKLHTQSHRFAAASGHVRLEEQTDFPPSAP